MREVFYPVKNDLVRLRERIESYYIIREGNIEELACLGRYADEFLCSALVFFTARIYGKVSENVVVLAEVLQLVYIASLLHAGIKENTPAAEKDRSRLPEEIRYPVLAGDYIHCRAFSSLVNNCDMTKYIGQMADLVCMISEGGILRRKNFNKDMILPHEMKEIIRLETAEFFAACCRISGEVAGAGKKQQQSLRQFGFNLGMAIGMANVEWFEYAETYFEQALSHLENLNPGPARDNLRNLLVQMMDDNVNRKRMVV